MERTVDREFSRFLIQVSLALSVCRTAVFCEGPTLVPVFANRKKSEEDFGFYRMLIASLFYAILVSSFLGTLYFGLAAEACMSP